MSTKETFHYRDVSLTLFLVSVACMGIKGGSIQTSEESVTLMNLEEDTYYSVTVRTVSTAAVGDPSPPIIATTSIAGT